MRTLRPFHCKNCSRQLKGAMQRPKRTKLAAFKFTSIIWNYDINSAFKNAKASFRELFQLSHPDPEKLMCLFTHASDYHWGIQLTQVPKTHLTPSVLEQNNQPLALLSRSFNGSQRRWSLIPPANDGKDSTFAIVNTGLSNLYWSLKPRLRFQSNWEWQRLLRRTLSTNFAARLWSSVLSN